MRYTDNTLLAAAPGDRPLIHFWESEAVVFNTLSADTHLLSLPTARLLEAIVRQTLTHAEVARAFASENASRFTGEQASEYLDEALDQLISLDLVQVLQAKPA